MAELKGFTLFSTNKGWQLSTQKVDQEGWSVKFIPEEHAQAILAQIGGSDGPYSKAVKSLEEKETHNRNARPPRRRILMSE